MRSSKQGGDLYKPIIKEGTHLALSKKTPDAFCGTQLSDVNNQVDGHGIVLLYLNVQRFGLMSNDSRY